MVNLPTLLLDDDDDEEEEEEESVSEEAKIAMTSFNLLALPVTKVIVDMIEEWKLIQ